MIVGIVNIDYALFCFGDDEFIEAQVEAMCDSLYMEAKLRAMGYDFGTPEDEWNI